MMTNPISIRFIKLHKDAVIPEYKTVGSVGLDLSALEKVVIKPAGWVKVRTGLVAQILPKGAPFHLEVVLRSSTPKVHKGLILANHIGIIDQDYSGIEDELFICLYNTSNQIYSIEKGERIAQVVIRPTIRANILVEEINSESKSSRLYDDRSRGGLGSTGR